MECNLKKKSHFFYLYKNVFCSKSYILVKKFYNDIFTATSIQVPKHIPLQEGITYHMDYMLELPIGQIKYGVANAKQFHLDACRVA